VENHCTSCSFFDSKRGDKATLQSSLRLKEWVASNHQEFDSTRQQDPSEFVECLLTDCSILDELTKVEIINTYKCTRCHYVTDDSNSDGRNKNIIYLNVTSQSVAQIVSNSRTNLELEFKRCLKCGELNEHEKKQNWMILPKVLIISLGRTQTSKFCSVEPSIILEIDEVIYALQAVITHHGKHVKSGHITATLHTKDGWITCDDDEVKPPTKIGPKDGLIHL